MLRTVHRLGLVLEAAVYFTGVLFVMSVSGIARAVLQRIHPA